MVINHEHPKYRHKWKQIGKNRYNGAFYYSKEICKNIIPNVKTDRNWITINIHGVGCDHSIVFIHNNLHPDHYDWLADYKDLVLVCGVPETVEKVAHLGKAIYLPLSIDLEYIEQFKGVEKDLDTAFIGRKSKMKHGVLPSGIDYLYGIKRQNLLPLMARYKRVYAVGRTAIEARALGCEILPYDERYPNTDRWQVIDNRKAAAMLQEMIDEIDGKE